MTRDEIIQTEPPEQDEEELDSDEECVVHRWRAHIGQPGMQKCVLCPEVRELPRAHLCIWAPTPHWRWEICYGCGEQREASCATPPYMMPFETHG